MHIGTRSLFFVASSFLIALVSSCGGGDSNSNDGKNSPNGNDGDAFPSTNLAGTIDGKAWQFKTGSATIVDGDEAGQVHISLTESDVPRVCNPFGSSSIKNQRKVLFSTAPKVGIDEHTQASGKSITFAIEGDENTARFMAGYGTIKIDEITRSMIRGRLSATFNGSTGANGAFTAKRCLKFNGKPEDDFIADSTLDSSTVGHWQGVVKDFTGENLTWTYDFRADGVVTVQAKDSEGTLIFDMDQTWKSDSGVNPRRMIRLKSVMRKDGYGLSFGRDKEACIYDVTTTVNQMTIACSNGQFRDEFPDPKSSNYLILHK